MKIPPDIKVFGDLKYRNKNAPTETAEQITFFNWLGREYPQYAALAMHIKNEGKKTIGQAVKDAANGLNSGAADIIILGVPPFVCELKKSDQTKSRLSENQITFLRNAATAGCFACVALGAEGVKEAFKEWIASTATPTI